MNGVRKRRSDRGEKNYARISRKGRIITPEGRSSRRKICRLSE
jgi:hypothetical protein